MCEHRSCKHGALRRISLALAVSTAPEIPNVPKDRLRGGLYLAKQKLARHDVHGTHGPTACGDGADDFGDDDEEHRHHRL